MIEAVARGAQFLLAIGIAYLIAVWFALAAWTFRDIEARSRSVFTQVFSTLLVVLFFIPGLLLYLILRPKETLDQAFQRALEEEYLLQDLDDLPLCQGCQRAVAPDFVLCPHCQIRLRGPCPACSRLIDLRWAICPYCAVPVDRAAIDVPGGLESVRVLENETTGKRKRAIAAAARRMGIEADELNALNEALAPGTHAAVAAGEATSTSRRVSPRESLAQFRRAAFGGTTPARNGDSADPTIPLNGPHAKPTRTNDGFWAEPLPGDERPVERPTTAE